MASVNANTQAGYLNGAINLAQDKMEEIRSADYANMTSGAQGSAISETGNTGGADAIYTRSWTVSAGPVAGTKEVVVTVEWNGTKQITLDTLVAE